MTVATVIPIRSEAPVIRITTELHAVVDQAVTALAGDREVYQRDGELVRITRTAETEADAMTLAGTPTVRRMTPATIREVLTRCSSFEKYDKRSSDYVDCLPTDPVVTAIASRGEYRSVRPIVGVAEAPLLRPDGTILDEPGYDSSTGYLYLPSADFPPVLPCPTPDDARAALAELAEVFADFPYRSDADRYLPIAALLTLLARPAIRGSVPAFIFDANTRGSGKTKQTDAIALIATGRPTAKMTYPPDPIELEKILASYALRGAVIIAFDNIVGRFGGGPLDRVLTAGDNVELRVLGKSEIPSLKWRAVIFATGNNTEVFGDTSRRVLLSRLESPLERPEDRDGFRHPDLLGWVAEHRPRLVTAALTVLRAWVVADRPSYGMRPWGSFEEWSTLVPPALVHAGAPTPLDCRIAVEQEDPERRALRTILTHWPRIDTDGQGLTLRSALGLLYPAQREAGPPDNFDELREALEELAPPKGAKHPDAKRLGNQLRRHLDSNVGGRALWCKPDRNGVAKWKVVCIQ